MEVEVVEAENGVNNSSNSSSSMAIDMALPGGFESDSPLIMDSSVETADLGEDWVSLFFDENYLNAMTTSGEIEQPFFQGTDDPTTAPDADGNQNPNQVLSHSTMILSSSPASATSGGPYSANVNVFPDPQNPLPTFAAISAPGTQETNPPLPTGSPESTISHGSGASSCAIQPNWWGNEDLEDDGGQHPENGSEEESSTSSFDASIPAAGVPVSKVPIRAQEVKGGAEPASSVGKIVTGGKGSVERSDRKRRSWEREEVENGQQQSCAQSEIDRKGSESGDGTGGDEDDEKRQARLMRNRESAQLSRQRKKVYVDELEGRLRTMAATIAELNATISHLTAENVNLRRQLGFFYQPARPGGGMPMMQYPGLISARPVYPGAPMPPVPIPRLKPQQSLTKAPKRSKSTREPGEKKKVKKVASLATVGVMGLLCITMLLGPFDWGSSTVSSGTTHIHVGNAEIRVGGRVLTSWNEESENLTNRTPREPWADGGGDIGSVNAAGSGGRNGIGDKARSRSERRNGNILRRNVTAGSERVWQSCSQCYSRQDQELLRKSEPRAAKKIGAKILATNVSEQVSLIVPRNNRLVKVDGNLIIRAVMAGDKAAEDFGKEELSGQEGENRGGQMKQDMSRSSRSPPTPADHQLIKAISTQAQEGGGIVVGERQSRSVGAIREDNGVQKPTYKSDALASVSATPTFSQLVLGSLAAIGFGLASTSQDQASVRNGSSVSTTISPGRNTTQVGLHPEVVLTILPPSSGWSSVIDEGDPRNKTWLAPDTCEAVPHILNVTLVVHECTEQPLSFGDKIIGEGSDRCRRLLQCGETFPITVGGLRLRTPDFCLQKCPEDHLQVAHILVNNQSHVGACHILWESTILNSSNSPIPLQPISMSAMIFGNKDMEEVWVYPQTFVVDRPEYVHTDPACIHSMWVKSEFEGGSTVMYLDIQCFHLPHDCKKTLQDRVFSLDFVVLKKGRDTRQAVMKEMYEIPLENQRAFRVTQATVHGRTRPIPEPMVGNLQQWVLDDYHPGPVLSTGMCTEVFRFDTSPAGAAPNVGASRASSTVVKDQVEEKTSTKIPEEPPTRKKRDPYAVPLPPIRRKDRNGTEPVIENVFKGQESQTEGPNASTMVVSVFTGPQDVSGEESRTGAGTGKGLSQIFVVVLVDSVKYITYSCMLPPTGSQVHVVAS